MRVTTGSTDCFWVGCTCTTSCVLIGRSHGELGRFAATQFKWNQVSWDETGASYGAEMELGLNFWPGTWPNPTQSSQWTFLKSPPRRWSTQSFFVFMLFYIFVTLVIVLCCITDLWTPIRAGFVPSVLWRCWLGGRKGIRPVKNWVVGCWRGYLSGARCRFAYAQLIPLPLTISCSSKIYIGFTFWFYLSGTGSQGAVKR